MAKLIVEIRGGAFIYSPSSNLGYVYIGDAKRQKFSQKH